MQNKKEPNESIYFVLTKLKNIFRKSLDAGTFFLNAAVLSRNILVQAEYQIRTWYQQILNIKGLRSESG